MPAPGIIGGGGDGVKRVSRNAVWDLQYHHSQITRANDYYVWGSVVNANRTAWLSDGIQKNERVYYELLAGANAAAGYCYFQMSDTPNKYRTLGTTVDADYYDQVAHANPWTNMAGFEFRRNGIGHGAVGIFAEPNWPSFDATDNTLCVAIDNVSGGAYFRLNNGAWLGAVATSNPVTFENPCFTWDPNSLSAAGGGMLWGGVAEYNNCAWTLKPDSASQDYPVPDGYVTLNGD